LNTLFDYPEDIRKLSIQPMPLNLCNVIRKVIKKCKLFSFDGVVKKVIYLAIQEALKKWTIPIRNWKQAFTDL